MQKIFISCWFPLLQTGVPITDILEVSEEVDNKIVMVSAIYDFTTPALLQCDFTSPFTVRKQLKSKSCTSIYIGCYRSGSNSVPYGCGSNQEQILAGSGKADIHIPYSPEYLISWRLH